MSTPIDDAVRVLRDAYYRTVELIAREIIDSAPDDEEQAILDAVDGSEWVIYTHRARIVALVSDNYQPAEFEVYGAFCAMCDDVTENVALLRREVPA